MNKRKALTKLLAISCSSPVQDRSPILPSPRPDTSTSVPLKLTLNKIQLFKYIK